ncbi:MAG: hypothetical protein RLZZ393_956 [Pseudomonadota bacterium]|jgi:uncharacterized membrane protein YfcA
MALEVIAVVLIGILAGFLNALASGGSAVAVPLLIAAGLTPEVANATNRLPVLFAFGSACLAFFKEGRFRLALVIRVLPPTVIGGIAGAFLADYLSRDHLTLFIDAALLIALLLLFTTTKQALLKVFDEPPRYRWQDAAMLFLVGVWLGLIVIDGAIYLLLVMILGMRLSMDQANAYKALVGVVVNLFALLLFAHDGNVDWTIGGLMALGSLVGGYLGARTSMRPWAKLWTYRVLVAIILMELAHVVIRYWQHHRPG